MKRLDSLNWKLKLSYRTSDEISELSSRFGVSSEISVKFNGENLEVILAFKKRETIDRDFLIFLNKSGAILKNEIYRINQPMGRGKEFPILFRKLISVNSCVLISSHIDQGEYFFDFIFNSNDIQEISSVVMENLSMSDHLNVDYLGPSGGFRNILEEINQRTKIYIAEVSITPPEIEFKKDLKPLGINWVRIVKMAFGDSETESVHFGEDGSHEGIGPDTTEVGKIYSEMARNKLTKFVTSEMFNEKIPSIFRIQTYYPPNYVTWTAIPSLFVMEQFQLMAKVKREMPEWKPVLKRIQPFGEWFQEIV